MILYRRGIRRLESPRTTSFFSRSYFYMLDCEEQVVLENSSRLPSRFTYNRCAKAVQSGR